MQDEVCHHCKEPITEGFKTTREKGGIREVYHDKCYGAIQLIKQAHENLTYRKGRPEYAPTAAEMNEEISRLEHSNK